MKMYKKTNIPLVVYNKSYEKFAKNYKGYIVAPNKLKKPLKIKISAIMAFEALLSRGEHQFQIDAKIEAKKKLEEKKLKEEKLKNGAKQKDTAINKDSGKSSDKGISRDNKE